MFIEYVCQMKRCGIKQLNMCMAGLLLTVMPVCAQTIHDKTELDAVLNPQMVENATGKLSIEPKERSIGVLSEDTVPVSYTFFLIDASELIKVTVPHDSKLIQPL